MLVNRSAMIGSLRLICYISVVPICPTWRLPALVYHATIHQLCKFGEWADGHPVKEILVDLSVLLRFEFGMYSCWRVHSGEILRLIPFLLMEIWSPLTFAQYAPIQIMQGLQNPTAVVGNLSSFLYISDTVNDRVLQFDEDGYLQEFTTTDPLLLSPRGMALDSLGYLYTADSGNNRVVQFNAAGGIVKLFTTTAPSLATPCDVAVDSSGNVYVADRDSNRIVKLNSAGSQQAVFTTTSPALSSPQGLALDGTANIFIADTDNNRIVKLSPTGSQMAVFTTSPSLDSPRGVTVDSSNHILIAGMYAGRIVENKSKWGFV